MYETEGTGMQRLAGTSFETVGHKLAVRTRGSTLEYLVTSIAFVIEKRMAEMFHVYTYLVRTARFKDALHEGNVANAFQHLIVSNSVLPHGRVSEYCHLQTIVWVSGYLTAYSTRILLQCSPYKSIVVALGSLVEELYAKSSLRIGSLGHDE